MRTAPNRRAQGCGVAFYAGRRVAESPRGRIQSGRCTAAACRVACRARSTFGVPVGTSKLRTHLSAMISLFPKPSRRHTFALLHSLFIFAGNIANASRHAIRQARSDADAFQKSFCLRWYAFGYATNRGVSSRRFTLTGARLNIAGRRARQAKSPAPCDGRVSESLKT